MSKARENDPVFPWNDSIEMSSRGMSDRGLMMCLGSIFDILEQIRDELRDQKEET